ncbi:LysR family transcriptional regulator [Novosphingobium sp. TCA1]|jgi:DNA-binding transcriptional LysR family regulator|uniref:LysR family transcriptional regulator n=1 Tax=Novosphingobium pentaromativorans TaxID=205844 RepID=A0A2W5QBB5_9SPHN|nr:LysR family transcriptional regulator [Novosphingobium sp. TCA1]PZQ54767.1 MAG: LysR family transcriptional regulator [Novosphingobium pentaromativorans]GFE75587.1 LysR family transcriptional regulator [Novosphingobium sp. TCA1]
MVDIAPPSLDHVRTFLTVVEEGSFGGAARRLGRAVSVVSYAIAQLETQLDVRLFEREGSRKPKLTDQGRALLSEAHAIADDVDALLAKVRSLRQGLEPELSLAVDVMVPGNVLARLLRDFQVMFPSVPLRLHVEALGAVAALVLDRRATLAIAGPDIVDLPEIQRETVGSVEMTHVAAPGHPLAVPGPIPPGEARKHLQLVLTDRSPLTEGRDFAVFSPRSWRLADLGAKHALLKEGIGWGSMPHHRIAADLASGELLELELPERPSKDYALVALWRKDSPPGPAAVWVLDEIRERLAKSAV